MVKHKMQYSPEVRNDLDEIWECILMELSNESVAINTVNNITDAL